MNFPPPVHAPPSPPTTPRSPPGYAIDRRSHSVDEAGGDTVDERMMMRSIWLKLGLLDTINYKIDATLKKLSVLETRMDRLEISVKDGAVPGAAGGATGGTTVMENNHVTENNHNIEPEIPMDTKDQPNPKVWPKPAKRQERSKPVLQRISQPNKIPTPFSQTNSAGGVPTPLTQLANLNPVPPPPPQHNTPTPTQHPAPSPPQHSTPPPPPQHATPVNNHQPSASTAVDNVIPRSCMLNTTNKDECERKLRQHQHNGMYLIRKSERINGKVLMVWFPNINNCKHYKIFGDQTTTFQLDETPNFSSLVDLLHYYRDNTLPQSNVLLTVPYTG